MIHPRAETRSIIQAITFTAVPHLPREHQIAWVASKASAEAATPVSAGTVKNWWYATDDDERTVDSRHMDWARAKSRQIVANDNAPGRAGGWSPCSAEAVSGWAA